MAEESARAYALRRVRDALKQSGGDRNAAHRMVLQACARDARLLGGLTSPFLKGIITHAMQGAGKDIPESAKASPQRKAAARPAALPREGMDAMIGSLSERIGSAPGQSMGAALLSDPKPTKAGERHRKSIHILAQAFAQKRSGR